MVTPTPADGPLIAATIGFSEANMRSVSLPPSSAGTFVAGDLRGCVEGGPAFLQVGAGAERPTGTGEHHGAHGVVGVGLVECRSELLTHLHREGVETIGAVEPEDRDVAVALDGDGGFGLGGLPAGL